MHPSYVSIQGSSNVCSLPLSIIVDESYQTFTLGQKEIIQSLNLSVYTFLHPPSLLQSTFSRATSFIPHPPFLCSQHPYCSSLLLVKLTLSSDCLSHGYEHCNVFILFNISVANSNSGFFYSHVFSFLIFPMSMYKVFALVTFLLLL